MEPVAYGTPVAAADAIVRTRFMERVYANLVGGVAAFVALEIWLFSSGLAETITDFVLGTSWLLILAGFMLISWMANSLAFRTRTPAGSYGAYALLIGAEAVIFVPMLWIAEAQAPGAIGNAAWISLLAFAGLSGIAITSAKDFSFLGSLLKWGGVVAILLIVGAVLFGANLGTWFSVGMIALAGGAILYDTQMILRRYPADREVAAAMSLFASLALLFWYVLRLLSRR